jgi:uncharacterized delta-60 repeat protein
VRRALLLFLTLSACGGGGESSFDAAPAPDASVRDAGDPDAAGAPDAADPDAQPGDFTVTVSAPSLAVRQGATASVTIDVVRNGTLGPLTVTSTAGPTGVTTPGATIAADASTATLTYTAAIDARLAVPVNVTIAVSDGTTIVENGLAIHASAATPNDLDASFASEGLAPGAYAFSVASISGAIYVGGNSLDVFRFHADGTPDLAFGGGSGVLDFGNYGGWSEIVADASGRVVLCGTTNDHKLAVARLLVDGTADPAFGTNGFASIVTPGTASDFADCDVLADGSVILAGAVGDGTVWDIAAAKVTPAGALDATFGTAGFATVNLNNVDVADAMTLQGTRILIGGHTQNGGNAAVLVRFDAAGVLDPTFDGDGVELLATEQDVQGLGVLGSGQLEVVGFDPAGTSFVARMSADGVLDASFGTAGVARFACSASNGSQLQVPQIFADGSLIAACKVGSAVGMIRATAAGAPDPTFSADGVTTIALGDTSRTVTDIAVDGTGYLVAVLSDTSGVIARFVP